jgi:hypothetical protein
MSEYKVVCLDLAKRQMADLATVATTEGRIDQMIGALRVILQQLRTRPVEFGEQRYHLRHLHLLIYEGAVAPIGVCYGIHEENRFVVIRSFRLMGSIGPDTGTRMGNDL